MLSSDLDRIPTEGESVTCILQVSGSSVGKRKSCLWDFHLYSFRWGVLGISPGHDHL